MNIKIDDTTVAVLKTIFAKLREGNADKVSDALDFISDYVKGEGIYPKSVVDGFLSAKKLIGNLTDEQFEELKRELKIVK